MMQSSTFVLQDYPREYVQRFYLVKEQLERVAHLDRLHRFRLANRADVAVARIIVRGYRAAFRTYELDGLVALFEQPFLDEHAGAISDQAVTFHLPKAQASLAGA